MGHPSISQKTQNLAPLIISMALAGAIGAGLAVVVSQTSEQTTGWTQCFDTLESAVSHGADVEQALSNIQTERSKTQRQLHAYQRALGQLSADWRWEDPGQREWLELASEQTQAQIDYLQEADTEAGDTEGCLQQF